MNLNIPRNHFYKRKLIDTGLALDPIFPDLPSSVSATATLGTQADTQYLALGTTIPETPDYGDATLKSAAIGLYTSAVTMKDSSVPPSIYAYRFNPNITLAEGGYSLSTSGAHVSVYNSKPNNEYLYLEENFDGAAGDNDIDIVNQHQASSIITKTQAYIDRGTYLGLLKAIEGPSAFWSNYMDQIVYIDDAKQKVRVSWMNKGHTQWKVWATGSKTGADYLISYYDKKWTNLEHIQYLNTTVAPAAIEESSLANVGNTALDDFYATRNFSNPYNEDENDPMITTTVDLSTETSLNGGQSLRFYHNWGYNIDNAQLQTQLGISGNLNAQCARASLYDIPFPSYPFDATKSKIGENIFSDEKVLGNTQGVAPEIRIPMNITKLPPNIWVAIGDYGDGSGGTITPPQGNPYFFYGATASALRQTTTEGGTTNDIAQANAATYNTTFLRSVVVTFSNYKPKAEHTTVDKFLAYGLTNFYQGKNYDNIVGGFYITRWGIDGASPGTGEEIADCYATPLPVSRCPQYTGNAGGIPTEGNQIAFGGGMCQMNGAGNFSALNILSPCRVNTGNPALEASNRVVQLPMNSFFTARIFTDIFQYNNSGSSLKNPYAPSSSSNQSYGSDGTPADVAKRGAMMRVIFETDTQNQGIVTLSGSTYINLSGTVVDEDARNVPFIDIPFPIGNATHSTAALNTTTYSWHENPELYPKHMTIWVQNYPWVSGNIRNSSGDNTYDSLFYVGDSNVQGGAVRESEVFIDSIKLVNYEPNVEIVTAANSNNSLHFKSDKYSSPFGTAIDTDGNNTYLSRWVNSGPVNYTVQCKISGSSDSDKRIVKILNPEEFDTGFLENGGTVSCAATGYWSGGTDIATIDAIDTFTISTDPTGSASPATGATVVFTSTGTLFPPVNRADLTEHSTGQNVVIGFNDDNDLPNGNHSTNAYGYFLMNNFRTPLWSDMVNDPLRPDKTETQQGGSTFGAIYSQATANNYIDALGGSLLGDRYFVQTSSGSNISGAAYLVSEGNATVNNAIVLGTGANNTFVSTDGLRQKGFIYVNVSGSSANYSKWVKRENVLTSTRVTNCRAKSVKNNNHQDDLANNQIEVANTSIFNYYDENETYVIYLVGSKNETRFKKSGLKLDTKVPPLNNVVTFSNLKGKADDGTTSLLTEGNLYRLMVSPEKYYLSMLFDTPETRIPRSYSSVCGISQTPTTAGVATASGSTFNEFTFSYAAGSVGSAGVSGLSQRQWSVVPRKDSETLIVDEDYGYGTWDDETQTGGELFKGAAYLENYNIFAIPHENFEPASNFNFVVGFDQSATPDGDISIETDDTSVTVQKPALYTLYEDLPPIIRNFSVQPAVDTAGMPGQTFNYYDIQGENLNAVQFNWEEENADDIWYRMLMYDSVPVTNKYHRALIYVPLNEPYGDLNAYPSGAQYGYNMTTGYSIQSDITVALANGTDTRKIPIGQGGWALQLADTVQGKLTITGNTNIPGFSAHDYSQYTIQIHWTPSAADKDVVAHIMTVGVPAAIGAGEMNLWKDANNNIINDVGANKITGSSTIKCDGETPTSIIITFDENSSSYTGRRKLYIDGKLEASSNSTNKITAAPITLGGYHVGSSSYRGTTGFIEEFIIYDRKYDVVETSNNYIFSTIDIEDYDSPDLITNSAILVAADYHNFRGTAKADLGMSSSTTWRTNIA